VLDTNAACLDPVTVFLRAVAYNDTATPNIFVECKNSEHVSFFCGLIVSLNQTEGKASEHQGAEPSACHQ